MAAVNGILKAVDILKHLQLQDPTSQDYASRKKEKVAHCMTIADGICSSTARLTPKFSQVLTVSIETLLSLCDDSESDVRMVADECLNKIIRAMTDGNIVKVQIVLYHEIKNNGAARTLRTALWRFAQLGHMIRPIKGKAFVANLVPCIVAISERPEESVIETLANALPLILRTLGNFTTDNNVKILLKAFYQNISSTQAVFRRTAATMILTTCLNSRKPQTFLAYVLKHLIETLVPITEDEEHLATVIGVFGCLRVIMPHINETSTLEEPDVALHSLIQVYELCLHFAKWHSDHNVVNAALETLAQILQFPSKELVPVLVSCEGITRSRITLSENSVRLSLGTMSISTTTISGKHSDSTLNLFDPDIPEIRPTIEKWMVESENLLPVIQRPPVKQTARNEFTDATEKSLENYSGLIIGPLDNEEVEEGSDAGSEMEKTDCLNNISLPSVQSKEDEHQEGMSSVVSPQRTSSGILFKETDIGSFTDADVPLKYCCRYLVSSFLLTGNSGQLIPDQIFRVSVKSLALTCVAHIIRLYPNLLLSTLDKNQTDDQDQQYISDVLLFADHPDPQIRGNVAMVIGSFLKAVFLQSDSKYRIMDIFLKSTTPDKIKGEFLSLENLTMLLLKGLEDESATTCRQTLSALNICLTEMIESADSKYAIPILKALPLLVKNPYFLVKVKLVEVLSKLPYTTVAYISGSSQIQENVISVMIELLGDQDQRVRHATATAIVKIVPLLYYQHPNESAVTRKASKLTGRYLSETILTPTENSAHQMSYNSLVDSLPKPFDSLYQQNGEEHSETVESVLSRMVSLLTQKLIIGSPKFLSYGCCETLSLLSETFLTTTYPSAWDCSIPKAVIKKSSKKSNSRGDAIPEVPVTGDTSTPLRNSLISLTTSLLSSSPLSLDLSTHRHLMLLAGNLASGMALCNLHPADPADKADTDVGKLWGLFKDKQMHQHLEELLTHVIRILNTFVHVIDEIQLQQPNTRSALPPLPSAQSLSPKRKLIPDQKSKEKDEKLSSLKIGKEQMGSFSSFPHYMKLYDILKAANSNYKTTLEWEASEMYLSLLNASLQVLSQILEIATIQEAGRIAEEILHYLQTTVVLSPTTTVQCVQQLLKCLFGSNLSIKWTNPDYQMSFEKRNFFKEETKGFHNQCFQTPARQMADLIKTIGNNCRNGDETNTGWFSLLQRKGDRKLSSMFKSLSRYSDQKASVASFIRLFEPMVIKSLKQYTVTSSIPLQCRVLLLLSQLVQLRVNYCLLDQDQIFIGFVIKQFEFIEEGHIQETEKLIPKIFNFLVHLSYEKYHSKVIIGIPKIIQLCDGLMASGQPPLTHCIPALIPLVTDIFLARGSNSTTSEQKELETTRDVLISMLLRLVEYHQVIQLLAACLTESRYSSDGNGEEKWRRWSRLTIDSVLPVLAAGKIRLESKEAHIALVKLFSAVSPTVFRPVDPLLKVLFIQTPTLEDSTVTLERWLGTVNVVLLSLISYAKEEAMLARLSDLSLYNANFHPGSVYHSTETMSDPLNVTNASMFDIAPEKVLARFLFKVVRLITSKVYDLVGLIDYNRDDCYLGAANCAGNDDYLIQQFIFFLQLCIHMFESGSHCKVANATMQMIQRRNVSEEDKLPVEELNSLMLQLASKCPIITCQWTYLMTLLSFSELAYWERILATQISNNTPRSGLSRYGTSATTLGKPDSSEGLCSINGEIVRKGGIILFCDYVCENINDAEPLTWLLINHIEETIMLAREPPVKELLAAAVHRNPAASGLLVQAIAARCLDLSKPSFVKRLLQCLEGTHHSQSGALILAMVPRLLASKHLALSRLAAKIASRRAEILLMMTPEDIKMQLPREDFIEMMNTLFSTKLAKKHGALVSLLNKLGTQHYDLSPLELEHRRPFNPATIRNIQLDQSWFYLQTKLRCCHPDGKYSLLESAELLENLGFEDCAELMTSNEFNAKILKECIKLGLRKTFQKCQELWFRREVIETDVLFEENLLYKAAKQCLLQRVQNINKLVPKQREIFHPIRRHTSAKEAKYGARISELISDIVYWDTVFTIIPSVIVYIDTLSAMTKYGLSEVESKFEDELAKFCLLCFEVTNWMIKEYEDGNRSLKPQELEASLRCAQAILRNQNLHKVFGNSPNWVCTAAAALTRIVEYLLTTNKRLPAVNSCGLQPAMEKVETKPYAEACIQMATLIAWLEKRQSEDCPDNIPAFLLDPIKSLIVTVSRQSLVNSFVLVPPLVWKQGWHVVGSGPTMCHVPLLSSETNLLHEVDILEQFIYRVTLIGWTSRLQFEEIWMALLSVLNISQNEGMPLEELAVSIQATSLAVQAITSLLMQTLLLPCPGNPENSNLIHQPRDPQLALHKISSQKLFFIQETLLSKFENVADPKLTHGLTLDHIFHRGNIERVWNRHKYSYSQLSVPYLWASCSLHEDKLSSNVLELKSYHNNVLSSLSLDLNSCLRFLLELYSSWTSPRANTPLRLLNEVIKSILAISELFTERSQYQWMLDTCLDLSKVHPIENEILHQYLVIAACKAAAVLSPLNGETLEKVKRLVEASLKSGFLPARVFALHGILYLLQSAVFASCEETLNLIHPLAIEYIQKHIDTQDSNGVLSQSEEHQGVMWALVFFLLEHTEDTPPDAEAPAVLDLALTLVNTQNISSSLHQTLLQGLERLVATKSVVGKVAEQIVKVAVDRLKQASPVLALPALQLLLTCMYTGAAEKLNQPEIEEPLPDEEPEVLVQSIERTSAIFDRIKKGHPMEVEVLCGVLPGVLSDFFPPSEILTKVIGEFLSPQQPHPRLLSAVVFQVCERACNSAQLGLLQDWVVFSLPNFIQSLPIVMSTWCLSCFFISATTNPWLRAFFPHVQSRIGKYEYEDKKILCISAADFYQKLTDVNQKMAFVETFETAAKEPGTPFSDILASL